MIAIENLLEKGKSFSLLLLRTVVATRLILGTWPYAIRIKPMQEVIDFFQSLDLPAPFVSAYLSVYAQFLCGLLFLFGLFTRQAGLMMFINFTVAILAAHLDDPIEKSFQAWALWACSFHLMHYGAGSYSLDHLKTKS